MCLRLCFADGICGSGCRVGSRSQKKASVPASDKQGQVPVSQGSQSSHNMKAHKSHHQYGKVSSTDNAREKVRTYCKDNKGEGLMKETWHQSHDVLGASVFNQKNSTRTLF